MKDVIYMNNLPLDIFCALQTHVLEKAETAFDRSAGAMVERGGIIYRMYLDLSIDENDLGRTYTTEVEEKGKEVKKSRFIYYGGAKR